MTRWSALSSPAAQNGAGCQLQLAPIVFEILRAIRPGLCNGEHMESAIPRAKRFLVAVLLPFCLLAALRRGEGEPEEPPPPTEYCATPRCSSFRHYWRRLRSRVVGLVTSREKSMIQLPPVAGGLHTAC